jgi:predicted RNA-binding protein YlxR (DUF448 family)
MPVPKPLEAGGNQRSAPSRQRSKPQKPRHVPQRTCIACREVRPKRELIRVVRTPDGHVEIDATGKKSGRGAYLCARRSCFEPALHRGKLEQEFEVTLQAEDRAALEAYLETLPVEPPPAVSQSRSRKQPKSATSIDR